MNQNPDFVPQPEDERPSLDNPSFEPQSAPSMVIPVIEEFVHIDKKLVDSGLVRITKKVSEHEETVNSLLSQEDIYVERVALHQYVDTAPEVRYEGETMIIPVLREVLVKRLLLVEEVRVTTNRTQIQDSQQVTLRKEEIDVERIALNPDSATVSGLSST